MRALMWSMSEYYLYNLSAEVQKGRRETVLNGLHNGGYAPYSGHRVYGENERNICKHIENTTFFTALTHGFIISASVSHRGGFAYWSYGTRK